MLLLTAIIIFVYGLAIGSFLNVCIYRLPREESIVFTSSHCPQCNKPILNKDLIPLFSYILLRGKCRFCNAKISVRYPLIELLNAALYLLLFLIYGLSAQFMFYAILTSMLVIIAFIDLQHRIIPDGIVICTLIIGIIYHIYGFATNGFDYSQTAISAVIGLFAASGLLFLLAVLSKGGMGGGDIKMMAAFGLCIGWSQILLALFIASLYGSIAGGLLLFKKQAGLKSMVPFGPFLAAGIFTQLCAGDAIIKWYISLLSG